MCLRSHSQQTWGDIIAKVQASGRNSNYDYIRKLRKHRYNEMLQQQIQEHSKINEFEKERKKKQRQFYEQLVEEGKRNQIVCKSKQKKIQLLLKQDNKNLFTERNEQKVRSQDKKIRRDQFINIILQKNDERNRETKRKFIIQNTINRAQAENRMKSSRVNLENIRDKEQYDKYVENQFQNRVRERQAWKDKYIRKGSHVQTDQSLYRSILDKQVKERNSHKILENERIDEKLKPINHDLGRQSASPVYLGRIPQSFDRRVQMNILDKHLKMKENDYVRQLVFTDNSEQNPTAKRSYSKQSPNSQRQSLQPEKTSPNVATSTANLRQRQKRQYSSFDLITGCKKIFFV